MSSGARTVLLYLVPAALVSSGWLRLEDDPAGGRAATLLALALAPALLRPWWARAAGAVGAGVVAAGVVFSTWPLEARPFDDEHEYFGPLASRFGDGFLEFYDVTQPFVAAEHPEMHAVVLAAVFGFALPLALAIAARRPLVAGAVLLAGSVWPATLVPGSDLERGALTLAAVLALLAFGGRAAPRTYRPALVAGAVLVLAAVGASTSEAVAKDEFVSWQSWDPYDKPADPVALDFVWNGNYAGIEWPEEETTVLTVEGPRRNLYWRAATLDSFESHRWVEQPALVSVSDGPARVLDPMVPARGYEPERWVRAKVTIQALADEHLVGPSMPVAYEPPRGAGTVLYYAGGVAVLAQGLQRGQEYTVWAYAPRPTPKQLASAGPTAPRRSTLAARYLEVVPGLSLLPFGANRRHEQLANLFSNPRFRRTVAPYRPLFEQAEAIVGHPESEYAAVVALEAWFRSEGGFRYDEQPPVPAGGRPPLVGFVVDHKRGYCQLYAGSMALMLRYLGIPARVAVGFTSGEPNEAQTRWTVTDRNAHAWVEVWFNGWGWLPFDPTPARGELSSPYSFAAPNFAGEEAAQTLGALAGGTAVLEGLRAKFTEARVGDQAGPGGAGLGAAALARERGQSLILLLLIVGGAAGAAITLAKEAVRRSRYLTRDPRRLAAACRRELVDVLADQGLRLSPAATPRELRREIERMLAVDVGPFAAALESARYAPAGEARAAARQARSELRRLRRRLRAEIGVPGRLRGAVSLRSLAA